MNKDKSPYVIFEVANVHGGDEDYLKSLVIEFSQVEYSNKGIKFQVFKYDKIALSDFEWFSVYEKLFFTPKQWSEFIASSALHGDVWIDVFDTYGVTVLQDNIDNVTGIKIQASVIENYEVREALEKIDLEDKCIMINVSGLELDKSQEAYSFFRKLTNNIIIQVGYQDYPTKIEYTALQKIPVLQAAFPKVPICMADHADATSNFSIKAPVYAYLLGCQFLEKHFCLDRSITKYDAYSSLEPNEIKQMCRDLVEARLASNGNFITSVEKKYLEKSVQIPVLNKNMEYGALISTTVDVNYRRTSQDGVSLQELLDLQSKKMVLSAPKNINSTITKNDYKNASIAVIVACRMKSTRLPQKAILPIAGTASVERCLQQCMGIKGAERVVLATSNLDTDSILKEYTLSEKVDFWQGEPDDVISRYLGACDKFNVDVVVRVTADCPIILPDIIDYLIEQHFSAGADFTTVKNAAVGSVAEIINVSALKKIKSYFDNAEYSEYMTWYFKNNRDIFKINEVELPKKYVRNYRLTLDHEEDLEMFEKLYSKLPNEKSVYFSEDVFEVLDNNPDISKLNSHITLKYQTDKQLINLLNLKTKMLDSTL